MKITEAPLDATFLADTAYVPDTIGATPNALPSTETQLAQPVPSTLLTEGTLATSFDMIFNLIATGTGGEFWQLKEKERDNLAKAWLPVLGPLLDAWGVSGNAPIVMACLLTVATLAPRLALDAKRRASETATTETAKSGASPSLPVLPAAGSPAKPIDLFEALAAA